MKTKVTEIKSAHVISHSPLIVQITYTSGGSDRFDAFQLDRELTPAAQAKARQLAGLASQVQATVESDDATQRH